MTFFITRDPGSDTTRIIYKHGVVSGAAASSASATMDMNGAVIAYARHTTDLACFTGTDRHEDLLDSTDSPLKTPHDQS